MEKKNPSPKRRELFKILPFALTGGFSLFLAFNARLFVMFAFTYFLENAAAGALPLEPFERTFQGLIFADTNLGHCYPSPRSIQWPADITLKSENHNALYSQSEPESTFFHKHAVRDNGEEQAKRLQDIRSAIFIPPRIWK